MFLMAIELPIGADIPAVEIPTALNPSILAGAATHLGTADELASNWTFSGKVKVDFIAVGIR